MTVADTAQGDLRSRSDGRFGNGAVQRALASTHATWAGRPHRIFCASDDHGNLQRRNDRDPRDDEPPMRSCVRQRPPESPQVVVGSIAKQLMIDSWCWTDGTIYQGTLR